MFIGLMNGDYQQFFSRDLKAIDVHAGTGAAPSVAAGRISYFFGLQGPSIVTDGACAIQILNASRGRSLAAFSVRRSASNTDRTSGSSGATSFDFLDRFTPGRTSPSDA